MTPISPAHKSYLKGLRRERIIVRLIQILIFAVFLILWEVSVRLDWIDGFIFSSPSRVWNTFFSMAVDGSIFYHICITLSETLESFLLVVVIGTVAAVLLWLSERLSKIIEPYLIILNSLPKSALAPLLIVWLGTGMKTIIVTGISIAIFGTILNLYTGFQETSSDKQKLIYTLHGTKKDVLLKVLLPSTIPLQISIMKVNIGLCLVGVVIGEFLAAREGLGYLIIYGSQVFSCAGILIRLQLRRVGSSRRLFLCHPLYDNHFHFLNRFAVSKESDLTAAKHFINSYIVFLPVNGSWNLAQQLFIEMF